MSYATDDEAPPLPLFNSQDSLVCDSQGTDCLERDNSDRESQEEAVEGKLEVLLSST